MQQVNFNGNLDQSGNTTIYIIVDEWRETILDFSWEAIIDIMINSLLLRHYWKSILL